MRLPISIVIFGVTAALTSAAILTPRIVSELRGDGGSSQPGSRGAGSAANAAAHTALANPMTYVNKHSGDCLDSNAAGDAYVFVCNNGDYQRWNVTRNADGTWTLRNLATNLCLDSDDESKDGTHGALYTMQCNGGDYQHWTIVHRGELIAFRSKATELCLWNSPDPATSVVCKLTDTSGLFWWKPVTA
jgi:hypothetical protein